MTFESGFADTERAATAATKAVGTLAAVARQFHKAAVEGDILKMRKASERLSTVLESTRQEVGKRCEDGDVVFVGDVRFGGRGKQGLLGLFEPPLVHRATGTSA